MASLKKNFFYSSILTTANYIFPLITYPYVSRVLGVTNIGICNFVDSIINYYSMFSLMGIVAVGIRSVAAVKSNKDMLSKTFSNLLWLNTISTTIVVLALIVSIFCIPKFYEYKELMLIGVTKVIFSYLMIDWFYKGLENFKYITTTGIAVKIAYVISIFLFVKGPNDYSIYYLLSVLMIVICAIINILYSKSFVIFNFKIKQCSFRPYIHPFLTIGVYILLTSMYTTFNIVFLGFVCNETEVGYYTTATKLHAIFIGMFSAFTGVMLPRMSSLISEKKIDIFEQTINKSFNLLFVFALPIVIFTEIFAPQIINIIAGPGYNLAITPMRIVMPLIMIIGYEQILVLQILMPMKQDKQILIGSCIGAFVGIICNVLLVKTLKSTGSAIAWLISELTVLIIAKYFSNNIVKLSIQMKNVFLQSMLSIPCIIILFVVKDLIINNFASLIIGISIVTIYYLIIYIYIIKSKLSSL